MRFFKIPDKQMMPINCPCYACRNLADICVKSM